MSSIIGQALHYQGDGPAYVGVQINAAQHYDAAVSMLREWRDAEEPRQFHCSCCQNSVTAEWQKWALMRNCAAEILARLGEVG